MSMYIKDKNGEIKKVTPCVGVISEAMKEEALNDFWDSYQMNGTRMNYQYCFAGNGWSPDTLKPKYTIKPGSGTREAQNIFQYCNWRPDTPLIDMSQIPTDFSECTNLKYLFSCARATNIYVDASNSTTLQAAFQTSDWGSIDKITLKVTEKCTNYNETFYYTGDLIELTFVEGSVIAANGINLKWSTRLSHDSVVSVINALSSSTSGLSVTLSQTAVNKAFETSAGTNDGSTSQEWLNLIATKSNWTISLS